MNNSRPLWRDACWPDPCRGHSVGEITQVDVKSNVRSCGCGPKDGCKDCCSGTPVPPRGAEPQEDAPRPTGRDWLTGQRLPQGAQAGPETPRREWPDPTPEMCDSPQFEAVWQCIKKWDIEVPDVYTGYMGATGNHVRAILDSLGQPQAASVSALVERVISDARRSVMSAYRQGREATTTPAMAELIADDLSRRIAAEFDAIAALSPTPAGPWTREQAAAQRAWALKVAGPYFNDGRCSGHHQFNGRYCRDAATSRRWCIHCAGFMLLQALLAATLTADHGRPTP